MERKEYIAKIFSILRLSDLSFYLLSLLTKNDYIRVINYHEVKDENLNSFEKHLRYYNSIFNNVTLNELKEYLNLKLYKKNRPGLLITFDDGFEDNYYNALPLLEKYNFTACFLISAGNVGKTGYMSWKQINELLARGHSIGSHTFSHHRMCESDNCEILKRELFDSKKQIENFTNQECDVFCWCGGEKGTYTRKAFMKIKEYGYKYTFMTNSFPVLKNTNRWTIERTNIQTWWTLETVKFQLSGLLDLKYKKKRSLEEGMADGL